MTLRSAMSTLLFFALASLAVATAIAGSLQTKIVGSNPGVRYLAGFAYSAEDSVFYVADDSNLFAVSIGSGASRTAWSFNLGLFGAAADEFDPFKIIPLPQSGVILVSVAPWDAYESMEITGTVALNASNGAVLWINTTFSMTQSSVPLPCGTQVPVTGGEFTSTPTVGVVDSLTGMATWTAVGPGPGTSLAAAGDTLVAYSTSAAQLIAYDAPTGHVLWSVSGFNRFGTLTEDLAVYSVVYALNATNSATNLTVVNLRTGAKVFTALCVGTPDGACGQAAVSADGTYLTYFNGGGSVVFVNLTTKTSSLVVTALPQFGFGYGAVAELLPIGQHHQVAVLGGGPYNLSLISGAGAATTIPFVPMTADVSMVVVQQCLVVLNLQGVLVYGFDGQLVASSESMPSAVGVAFLSTSAPDTFLTFTGENLVAVTVTGCAP